MAYVASVSTDQPTLESGLAVEIEGLTKWFCAHVAVDHPSQGMASISDNRHSDRVGVSRDVFEFQDGPPVNGINWTVRRDYHRGEK